MAQQRSAIVVGAGVVGMATAYALARRGWNVHLVDKGTGPATGCSFANGAQLSYCYTDALASPAVLANALSIIFGGEGLGLTPQYNAAFAGWVAAFLRNCTSARFEHNTMAGLALAQESKAAMDDLLNAHDITFGRRVAGKMHLYFTEAEFEIAKRARRLKASLGCKQVEYTGKDVASVDPSLQYVAGALAGAIYTPDEEIGDAFQFCRGLLPVLSTHFGITSSFGKAVRSIALDGNSAKVELETGETISGDMAVICAGSASKTLLRPLGLSVPIQSMKGYSFEMPLSRGSPSVSITDPSRKIVFTNMGDRMRVAGFADVGNVDPSVDPRASASLVEAASKSLPDAGDYDLADRHWAGLRPMTPNSQPIISHPRPALAINAGHGMLGWTLAMGAGERLAKLVS